MINIYSPTVLENRMEILEIEPHLQKAEKKPELPAYLPVVRFLMGILTPIFPRLTAKIAFRIFRTPRTKAKHRVSDKTLEAAKINEILVGSNIIKVYEWGTGDRNILLAHGWESRGTAMRSFVQPLLNQGFRVIAFDGPAHGNSTGKRTNILEFADTITAIINRLGGVEAVITHSFGGMCLTYASRLLMPEVKIPKAVMVAVPSNFDDILLKIGETMNFADSVKKEVDKMVFEIAGEYPIDMHIPTAVDKTQIEDLLVVHDKKDPIVEFKFAEQIHEAWPNSQLIVTEGLGHYRIMKHPVVINRVVDFITKK